MWYLATRELLCAAITRVDDKGCDCDCGCGSFVRHRIEDCDTHSYLTDNYLPLCGATVEMLRPGVGAEGEGEQEGVLVAV